MSATRTPAAKRARTGRLKRFIKSPLLARILSFVTFLVVWQLSIPLLPTLLVPTPAEVAEFMWAEIRGDTLAPQTVYEAFGTSMA